MNNIIEGFNADGERISAIQFLKDLKEAESQIEKGDFLTYEELEEEIQVI